MLKTLPYNALRTLESVVRLRGFGRAAEELNVTQSAVSQHIKLLEDWLGHQLLVRQGRQTIPTQTGELLASTIRDGFGAVSLICDEVRNTNRSRRRGIHVAAPPGFAFIWLLPRLLDFDEKNPDIPISLSTDPKSQDPSSSDADVVISYSAGGFPDLHAEKLMSEVMSPVCSPQLGESLNDINDLANHTILRDTLEGPEHRSNWEFWAKEVNVTLPHFPQTRVYGQANLVVQAAKNGSGIAMGRSPLVEDSVQCGKLVYPFTDFASSQFSYWFVCRHSVLKSKSVQEFRSWLHGEAQSKGL